MKHQINIRFSVLLAITLVLGIGRFITLSGNDPIWNFTPIGAMALFAGTYFTNLHKSYIFPMLILFISDLFLMQFVYAEYRLGFLYEGWYWTYGSFFIMILIGRIFRNKVSIFSFILSGFLAALIHYIVSDFGVWIGGGLDLTTGHPYTRDWNGIVSCYVQAIPYFKNILLGNLVYGMILFGGFEWAQSKFTILRVSH